MRGGAFVHIGSRAFLSIAGAALLLITITALLIIRSHFLILCMAQLVRLVISIPTKHGRRQHDKGQTSHRKLRKGYIKM